MRNIMLPAYLEGIFILTCTPCEFKTRTGVFLRLSNRTEDNLSHAGTRRDFFTVFGNPLLDHRNLPAVHQNIVAEIILQIAQENIEFQVIPPELFFLLLLALSMIT